jgi:hypothetical protein
MGVEVLPPGAYRYTCVERDNDCVATPGANENERPTMTLERPAISYFRFESAASFFYWEQGGFVRVWISD